MGAASHAEAAARKVGRLETSGSSRPAVRRASQQDAASCVALRVPRTVEVASLGFFDFFFFFFFFFFAGVVVPVPSDSSSSTVAPSSDESASADSASMSEGDDPTAAHTRPPSGTTSMPTSAMIQPIFGRTPVSDTARDLSSYRPTVLPGDEPYPTRERFALDPALAFLNHGSFGACPRSVLERQLELRSRMERNPMQFFVRDLEGLLDEARAAVAPLVGAEAEDLAFVPNATTAVNAVVRSLDLAPGDELLVTSHGYAACSNALVFAAQRAGARVVTARVPFPIEEPDEVVRAIVEATTPRTRLALVDHVTSPTGLVFPIADIVRELSSRGVDTLVDAAHALGMVPCDVEGLGAAYWTSNAHKWLCAPKGTAILHVRKDRQGQVRPTSISHGALSTRADRSRFLVEFDWTGTVDPTGPLTLPACVAAMEDVWPGGLAALRERNRALALRMRAALCARMGVAPPAPESMIGALAAVPIGAAASGGKSALDRDPLQEALAARGVEVPVVPNPGGPGRLLRVSAQAYVRWRDLERLIEGLAALGVAPPG